MRRRIVLCCTFLLGLGVVAIAHEQKPSITVAGQAVVLAVPDQAIVTLSIQTVKYRQRVQAKEQLDRSATTLVSYFDTFGVPEQKYKMTHRQIRPFHENSGGTRHLVGYTGYQRFVVELSLDAAEALLDGLPDVANEDSTTFYVSNARALRDTAVDEAIEDAKTRARRRASILGIVLGGVIGMQESNLGPARAQQSERFMAAVSADAKAQLPAGEDELRVNVTITYRILESVQ